MQALSFASPALGSCRVPAPALEPGAGQHAAAPACDSAFARQSRKRQAVCCSGTTDMCKKGKETSRNTRCTAGCSVACGHHDSSLQWQALDDCIMLMEVLRCAPYVAGGAQIWRVHGTHTGTVTCRVFFCLFLLRAFRPYFSPWTSARCSAAARPVDWLVQKLAAAQGLYLEF